MADFKGRCFVIMPFAVELRYFYLFLKQHIEREHKIECERADDQILTIPILEKINDYIRQADVIIADCTGNNPNVFYELGLAHAHGKKVILISRDSPEHLPFDVRPYELISYGQASHVEFLSRLDNALDNVFSEQYEKLRALAQILFDEFKRDTQLLVHKTHRDEFLRRVKQAERSENLPPLDDRVLVANFVLPCIIEEYLDIRVGSRVNRWLLETYPGP